MLLFAVTLYELRIFFFKKKDFICSGRLTRMTDDDFEGAVSARTVSLFRSQLGDIAGHSLSFTLFNALQREDHRVSSSSRLRPLPQFAIKSSRSPGKHLTEFCPSVWSASLRLLHKGSRRSVVVSCNLTDCNSQILGSM